MIDPSTINITDPSIFAAEEQELHELGQEKLALLVRLARRYLALRNTGIIRDLTCKEYQVSFVRLLEEDLDNYTDKLLK